MWVASYGVTPHAYSRACGPGAASTSSPVDESWTRTGSETGKPGSSGTWGVGQACTRPTITAAHDAPGPRQGPGDVFYATPPVASMVPDRSRYTTAPARA